LYDRHHRVGAELAAQVKAAVNLEARGTSGPSLMFETGSANAWLMHLYESVVARPFTNSMYYVVYKLLPNDTDFTVFKKAGYQGFNFGFIGNVGAGGLYILTTAMDWGQGAIQFATADYGTKFMIVAGLLNFIAVADAYHIAIGKKQ